MYTRNLIERQMEREAAVYELKKFLKSIDEKYDIEDAVFGFDPFHRKFDEIVEGYMGIANTYDNIDEALRNIDSIDECLHIVRTEDGHTYTVGTISTHISDLTEGQVMDIETLKEI
jgi:hypothetical protein